MFLLTCRSWWLMGLDPGYNIPELICQGGQGPVGLLGDEGFVKQGWDWGWCWLGLWVMSKKVREIVSGKSVN